MIIECINCNKKFEVSDTLIPELGRKIQCGSCDHTWFYKPTMEPPTLLNKEQNIEISVGESSEIKENNIKIDQKFLDIPVKEDVLLKKTSTKKILNDKKNTRSNFGKILSYFIVSIISFVALVIILDTFKSPLSNKIPSLELLLYNLFESLKDIFLFIKDLFV
tara:strand:+ start:89 stop:577 length:489 start_codon:yes stop_codon:yes gene_type:complete